MLIRNVRRNGSTLNIVYMQWVSEWVEFNAPPDNWGIVYMQQVIIRLYRDVYDSSGQNDRITASESSCRRCLDNDDDGNDVMCVEVEC